MGKTTGILVLISLLISGCRLVPATGQISTRPAEAETPVISSITPSIVPPTATKVELVPTRRPKIDPATAATQSVATVAFSQITWSGSISASVFRQLTSQETDNREAFGVPKSEEVFGLSARPIILAAYVYEVSSEEKRHARFLLYEPGGKWEDEVVLPFLYKMDLPLSWIGGHEDYGDYDQLIRGLEAQFEHPISPNKLKIACVSAIHCADASGVYQKLCAELDKQGIKLPVDHESAKAMVVDQWDLAIRLTSEVGDVGQVVEFVNTSGTAWWDDSRFVLFYLPNITVCLPGDPPVCGTYISYEMFIDTFGLLRP